MKPNENRPPDGRSPADTEQIISVIVYVLVGIVALFTFVVSYSHIYDLGRANGQHGIAAKGTPLSVDLLIVAASLILWLQARTGARPDGLARWLPRLMLYSGIVATVLANVAYGWSYGRLGAVLSAWPGYVFAGLAETVMVTARWQREQSREPVKHTVIPAGHAEVPATAYEAAATAHAASLAGGNPLTEYQLHKRFGIARSVARKIVTPAAPELAAWGMNGDGSHE